MLKVMAGDVFSAKATSWYRTAGAVPATPVSPLSSLLSALVNSVGNLMGGSKTVLTQLQQPGVLDPAVSQMLNNQANTPTSIPKAGLYWVLLDNQLKYVTGGFDFVGGNEQLKNNALLNIQIPKNGYLYIYTANQTPNIPVFFDNLQVVHQRGQLLEEKHYYPMGLLMEGISSRAAGALPTRQGYQGKELQTAEFLDGTGLDEYDFVARYYDPQLGRWHNPDPANQFASPYVAMGNNWISGTDPDGRFAFLPIIIGAVMGAMQSGAQAVMNGGSFWDGAWKGALTGAVGGALGGYLQGIHAFSNLGMVGSGMINGAITGTIVGGLSAGLNGGNVWQGMLNGGITGAINGGITGALERASMAKVNSIEVPKASTTWNGEYFQSEDELSSFIDHNIGNTNEIENSYKTNIQLASAEQVPSGYFYNDHNKLMYHGTAPTGGYTTLHDGWFSSLKSDIYISPGIKGVFNSGHNLAQMVISHEILHAYHLSLNLPYNVYKKYTESAASAYSLAYTKSYNMSIPLQDIYRSGIQTMSYPRAFSWENLANRINMGIIY